MSCFLFGSIRLRDRSLATNDSFALKLATAGAECRIYVLVGGNVWQKPVVDILRDHHLLYADCCLPVMITQAPQCNTSDELIAPYTDPAWDLGVALSAWTRVGKWIGVARALDGVHEMELFTTEGHEIEFEELEATPSTIAKLVVGRIEAARDLPSLKIRVMPQAEQR